MNRKKRALVLGIGNTILRDEGLGVRTIEYFRENFILPAGAECVDGGTAGLGLLPLFKDFDRIIIVDAVTSGSPPGSIHLINAKELKKGPASRTTAHQIGVAELLELARFEGHAPEVMIVGVVPKDISPGLSLSRVIEKKLPEAADMIASALDSMGVKVKRKNDA